MGIDRGLVTLVLKIWLSGTVRPTELQVLRDIVSSMGN